MTPLEIEILFHYYHSTNDYRDGDFSAPAVRQAIDDFRGWQGLIQPDDACAPAFPSSWSRSYRLTDRATTYLEHLMAQPLPVSVWVIPASIMGRE